ncbi:hypothetical protein PR202_ga27733 [Eleusine coracana subsp. coracana]|uniref:Rubisco LSMT substrate-binding domain-containing protein n=1 Tax=Eleusine coracana subsp. coracana TaxID=191504 RepID=A0AAV5DFJ4_ELECO|nr:hypothetical protein PR202_ga27733 [Eleusine coracana subsp. coracana]
MQKLLESRSLSCIFQVPVSCSAIDAFKLLDRMIQATRVVYMDELELYFAGDDDIGPFSARNELESLNLLFKIMNSLLPTCNAVAKDVLQRLQDEIVVRLTAVGKTDDAQMIVQTQNHDAEDSLLKWGEHHGVRTKLQIAFILLYAPPGLSFGIDALATLEGTLLFDEIMQAKQVSPHILNYGRVDEATKSLKFPLCRPCNAGEQCFLSYGKHPGSHLITFYGFLPRGDNPYDVIPLDLDISANQEDGMDQSVTTSQTVHMVRGTWLSRSVRFSTYGLPQRLLSHLRAVLGCDFDESTTEADLMENDRVVLETLVSIFHPMLEALHELDDCDRENASWDVKLALDYKDLQRRIIGSIVTSCTSALEKF